MRFFKNFLIKWDSGIFSTFIFVVKKKKKKKSELDSNLGFTTFELYDSEVFFNISKLEFGISQPVEHWFLMSHLFRSQRNNLCDNIYFLFFINLYIVLIVTFNVSRKINTNRSWTIWIILLIICLLPWDSLSVSN